MRRDGREGKSNSLLFRSPSRRLSVTTVKLCGITGIRDRFRGQEEAVPPVPGGHVRLRLQRRAAPPQEARDALQGDFRGGGVLALHATEVRTRIVRNCFGNLQNLKQTATPAHMALGRQALC